MKKTLAFGVVCVLLTGCFSMPKGKLTAEYRVTGSNIFNKVTIVSPKDDNLTGVVGDMAKGTYSLGAGSATQNPAAIDATGRVRQQDLLATAQIVAISVDAAVKAAAAYFTGGASLALPGANSAPTSGLISTLPVAVTTPATDTPTALPAGAVVPASQWRHYANEYWLPVQTLTSGERPPVGWKYSPAVAGPFCISGTTNCYIAIVPQ